MDVISMSMVSIEKSLSLKEHCYLSSKASGKGAGNCRKGLETELKGSGRSWELTIQLLRVKALWASWRSARSEKMSKRYNTVDGPGQQSVQGLRQPYMHVL
jgi:hypothetical protein